MMNKKLLRQIKQEGINVIDYDNELLTNNLIDDYKLSNIVPLKYWTDNELQTRLQELVHISYKLSILFPEYYRQEFCGYNGECYDIQDEIEARWYEKYQDYYPYYDEY